MLGVNTVSKRFLIAAAAGAFLLVALSIGLDFYVGSSGARERLEETAQRETGLSVKIEGIHYNLWSGLRATGIAVAAGANGTAISLPSISAQMAFRPLFSGRVVLKRLVFNEPSLVLAQNGKGGWDVPLDKPATGQPKAPQKSVEPGGSKGFKPEFGIQELKLKNARLRFVDKKGRELGALEGVTAQVALETSGKADGNLAVQSATMRNGLTLEAFRASFLFDNTHLTLSPMAVSYTHLTLPTIYSV